MKPIPFIPQKDLAPMVFSSHICQLAQEISCIKFMKLSLTPFKSGRAE